MDQIESIIKSKLNNVGSLCGFLRNSHNKKYLNFLNENIIKVNAELSISEKLYYYSNNIKSPLLCECGKHLKYIGFKNGYRSTCGEKECFVNKRKQTSIKNFGVDNPQKSEKVKEKTKKTILDKYNGKHYMNDEDIKEKTKKTMNERYGVNYAQQNENIKEKSLDTWTNRSQDFKEKVNENRSINNKKGEEEVREINEKRYQTKIDKYGSINNYNKKVQEKVKETSLEKYNTDHFLKNKNIIRKRVKSYIQNKLDEILNNIPENYDFVNIDQNENGTDTYIEINHSVCNNTFKITRQLFNKRINNDEEICLNCNKISSGYSSMEKEIAEFLSNHIDIKENYKIDKKEVDVYIPSKKLAIEFNGLYWHSELYKDKNYHLNKTKICNENDINLIHIWEDQWIYKKEIVKSMLLNKIGLTPNRIYARKCVIKEIRDTKLVSEFLDSNHIQGKVGSKVKLGLYYNDGLVSLMTFGNLRKNLGQKSKEGYYEMLRFCNKKDITIVGGASKLFTFFIKHYKPNSIISYASKDYSNGNLYENLGFELTKISEPNYYYIDKLNHLRMNRFNFRKDRLIKEGFDPNKSEHQIMLERGYYRIYDTGNFKFEYKK